MYLVCGVRGCMDAVCVCVCVCVCLFVGGRGTCILSVRVCLVILYVNMVVKKKGQNNSAH